MLSNWRPTGSIRQEESSIDVTVWVRHIPLSLTTFIWVPSRMTWAAIEAAYPAEEAQPSAP